MRSTQLTLLLSGAALLSPAAAQQPAAGATPPPSSALTKAGIPLTIYGFLRLDAYYNTARANSVVIPATVNPEIGKRNDDQFTLDPRLTRLGFDFTPGEVHGTTVKLKLETDFANFPAGVPESRATPRIRLAYLDLSRDDLWLRAGQAWDVISPLYPAVNHELLMWNAGNLGDRRPQIKAGYEPKDSSFDLSASLGLTGAVNNQDIDMSGERDGFDSGMPHLQARAGCTGDALVEGKPANVGLWGIVGQTETDTAFNGNSRFLIWGVGLDWTVPVAGAFTLRGEAWTGQNLGDVRGGIGQTINTTTGDEIASVGGWTEMVYAHTDKVKLHVGGSIDDPNGDDLNTGNPERNVTGYVGTVVDWDSGLRNGFDVIYWQTDWRGVGLGNMVRFNLYSQYNF